MRIESVGIQIHNNQIVEQTGLDPLIYKTAQKILETIQHPRDCTLSLSLDLQRAFYRIVSEEGQVLEEGSVEIESAETVSQERVQELSSPRFLAKVVQQASAQKISSFALAAIRKELADVIISHFKAPSTPEARQQRKQRIDREERLRHEKQESRKRERILDEKIEAQLMKELKTKGRI